MKTAIWVQKPNAKESDTILELLGMQLDAIKCDVVRIAVSYATIAGVRLLLDLIDGRAIRQGYWLIGLDDAVSHPDAIELLMKMKNSEVRVASYEKSGLRFHPKVFMFEEGKKKLSSFFVIGSANLTASALLENGEAVVSLVPQTGAEKSELLRTWSDLWRQGHVATRKEIALYRERYRLRRGERKDLSKVVSRSHRKKRDHKFVILQSDSAELEPSFADTCWIECGRITAGGRELEFKAEQALFFGLAPGGGNPRRFRFRVSDGTVPDLRMVYRDNKMWRLELSGEVPEVRSGLRPKLESGKLDRSPYVAVIERTATADEFALRFIMSDSREFRELEKTTLRCGTLGQTSARKYGWC